MQIKFNVSAVKSGSFTNDEQQVVNYGYVYAVGDFKDQTNTENFVTGLQMMKFRCPDKATAGAIRLALLKAQKPVELVLDVDFTTKEGQVSVPTISGIVQ